MTARALSALAVADFRERARRPGYLVTLAAAVALGYLALPPATSRWVIMDAGGYRGTYNTGYAATATALAGALWLMLGGFYVVRSAIARDRYTRVGQILAATPLSRVAYLAGKFASNLMVLASMAGALAATALVLQLARGESRAVDPVALLVPFVVLTLPVLAVTAGAAVLWEVTPGLRGGVGNLVWFFLWMILAIAGGGLPLGGLAAVVSSMRADMAAQHLPAAAEFSLGFTEVDRPLRVFTWAGLHPSGSFVAGRTVLMILAACLALLPAAWFDRFDAARARRPRDGGAAPAILHDGVARSPRALSLPPVSPLSTRSRPALARLVAGETRILIRGASRWWWLVAAALNGAGLVVPGGTAALLSAAWCWPVLVWSRLGTQRHENGVDTLLDAYPAVHRRLMAEWAAGLALTVVTGLGPVVRMAVAADGRAVAAWLAGAVFIPALALVLGTLTRTQRTFQVIYIMLWYGVVNGVAAVDYMGAVLVDGRPAGPSPLLIASIALAMLAVTMTVRIARHALR